MRKIYNLLLLSIFMIGAASCSSDDDLNVWDATYVYLMPEHLGIYTTEYTLTHKGDVIEGPETKMQFYVALNRVSDRDISVELSVDTSKTLKMDKVNLSTKVVTIPAGKLKSEPIVMNVEDWSSETAIKPETIYSADVNINKNKIKDVLVGTQSTLRMMVTKSALLNLESGVPAEGELIKNRAEWEITVQDGVENADKPERLVDGQNSDLAVNSGGFWFTVNLKQPTLVTGIRTNFWANVYAAGGIEVFVSDNGVKWESQGKLKTSGATQNVKFTKPVTTKYIKYNIVVGSLYGRLSVTEFNVYAK